LACALGLLLTSCSVLLDWSSYSADANEPADDAAGPERPDATAKAEATATNPPTMEGDSSPTDSATVDRSAEASVPDVAADGPLPCNQTCMGCCTSEGQCAFGTSADTCGTGGQMCQNCGTNLACVNSNCATPPVADSGPPPSCTPSACNQHVCIPVWQATCCKSDMTCGCYTLIPVSPCM
jgi:hypothetical protein